jgi:hypothetical protein
MSGTLLSSGVLSRRGTLTGRGAISQSGTLSMPDTEWSPRYLNPTLLLDPAIGALKSGGTSAGYLDTVATWKNQGVGASDATQTVSTKEPTYFPRDRASYLHCPGISGNYASVPHSQMPTVSTGVDMQVSFPFPYEKIPSVSSRPFFGKAADYLFRQTSNRRIGAVWIETDNTQRTATSPTTPPDNARALRAVIDTSNAAGVAEIQFFYALVPDLENAHWISLGTVTRDYASSIRKGTQEFRVGSYHGSSTLFLNGAVQSAVVKHLDGSLLIRIDFSDVAHGASSFVCDTGQTVTIQSTGSNPARIIGRPLLRTDGSGDGLLGGFTNPLTGCRKFAIYTPNDSPQTGRVIDIGTEEGGGTYEGGIILSAKRYGEDNTDLVVYANEASLSVDHDDGFSGRFVHEVLATADGIRSRRNGAEEMTGTSITIAGTRYGISTATDEGGVPVPMDLEYLAIFPATMSEKDVDRMRAYLTERFDLNTGPAPSIHTAPTVEGHYVATDYHTSGTRGIWNDAHDITGEWEIDGVGTGITLINHTFEGIASGSAEKLVWVERATNRQYVGSVSALSNELILGVALWDFTTAKPFTHGKAKPLTHSRSSEATLFNENGDLSLSEHNLVPNSANITGWTSTGSPSKNSQSGGGPFGDNHTLLQTVTTTAYVTLAHQASASPEYSVGLWLKYFSASGVISIENPSGVTLGQWTIPMNALVNWEFITKDHPAVTVVHPFVGTSGSGGLRIRALSGGLRVRVARVQTNHGPTLHDFVATSGSAHFGMRIDHQEPTGDPVGFLSEGQETNLVSGKGFSAAGTGTTLVSSTIESPVGTLDAYRFSNITDAAGDRIRNSNTATLSSSSTYYCSIWIRGEAGKVASVYAKRSGSTSSSQSSAKVVTLTGEWQRVLLDPWTTASDTTSGTIWIQRHADSADVIDVWGAQISGLPHSSTIINPNTSGTVIRQADTCYIYGGTGWYNQNHGVILAKVRPYYSATSATSRKVAELLSNAEDLLITLGSGGANYPRGWIDSTPEEATGNAPTPDTWEYLAISYVDDGPCFFARRRGSSSAASVKLGDSYSAGSFGSLTIGENMDGHIAFVRYENREITSGTQLTALLDSLP